MLNLYCLGTSSGVPTKTRNVSGLALRPAFTKRWCLVDCGEATQHRLQHAGLTLHDLAAVCITHMHGDHCFGLPGLLTSASMAGRTEPLTVIGPALLIDWLRSTEAATDSHLTFPIHFVPVESLAVSNEPCQPVAGVSITAHPLEHRIPSYAYRFDVRHDDLRLRTGALAAAGLPKGPLWGQLMSGKTIAHGGKTFHPQDWVDHLTEQVAAVVAGDNATPSVLRAACAGAQVLVHESTYLQALLDKVGPGPMHSSAKLLAEFAQSVDLPNLVMTHLSARYHTSEGETWLLDEARGFYRGHLHLARDGDVLAVPTAGVISALPSFYQLTPEN